MRLNSYELELLDEWRTVQRRAAGKVPLSRSEAIRVALQTAYEQGFPMLDDERAARAAVHPQHHKLVTAMESVAEATKPKRRAKLPKDKPSLPQLIAQQLVQDVPGLHGPTVLQVATKALKRKKPSIRTALPVDLPRQGAGFNTFL